LTSSADTGVIQTRAAKTDRAKRVTMNHLLWCGSEQVDRLQRQRNMDSKITAEPSYNKVAALNIEASAKASTKCAATTF
jgi:hypothetical protein